MSDEANTIQITGVYCVHAGLHKQGDLTCTVEQCSAGEGTALGAWPRKCVCGGVIHAAIDAATFNETYGGVDEQCDQCDDPRPAE